MISVFSHSKALFYNDLSLAHRIVNEVDPSVVKQLGKRISSDSRLVTFNFKFKY